MTTLEIQFRPPVIKHGAKGIRDYVKKLKEAESACRYSALFDEYASVAFQIMEDMLENGGQRMPKKEVRQAYGVSGDLLVDWVKLLGNKELRVRMVHKKSNPYIDITATMDGCCMW